MRMFGVPYDPLPQAVEMLRNLDVPEHKIDVKVRLLNVERAQAYALIDIAESPKAIRSTLESRQ